MYGYSLDIKMDPMSNYVALHLNWTLHSKSSFPTPIGGPTIQSNSNTNYPEFVQTPPGKGQSVSQDYPSSDISHKSQVSLSHWYFFLADYGLRLPTSSLGSIIN